MIYIYMLYRTEQANWAMIHATCLIWTKIKRGCGPSCETMAGVWKKALNATVPWGFCPLPARGYRASDRCCCCWWDSGFLQFSQEMVCSHTKSHLSNYIKKWSISLFEVEICWLKLHKMTPEAAPAVTSMLSRRASGCRRSKGRKNMPACAEGSLHDCYAATQGDSTQCTKERPASYGP